MIARKGQLYFCKNLQVEDKIFFSRWINDNLMALSKQKLGKIGTKMVTYLTCKVTSDDFEVVKCSAHVMANRFPGQNPTRRKSEAS